MEKSVLTLPVIKVGLLSDTHGYLDEQILSLLADRDEIWHAGDIGGLHVLDQLAALNKTMRVVYGNIDDAKVRSEIAGELNWTLEGKTFLMTHIGGYPGHYARGIKELLKAKTPDVFICGHSHILKVIFDKSLHLLHLNPGACGKHGFHQVRTMLQFTLDAGSIRDMAVLELGLQTT